MFVSVGDMSTVYDLKCVGKLSKESVCVCIGEVCLFVQIPTLQCMMGHVQIQTPSASSSLSPCICCIYLALAIAHVQNCTA